MSQKLRPLKKTHAPVRKHVKPRAPTTPQGKPVYVHEVRFVERKNGKMHNVEIFTLDEFSSKFSRLQEETMQKPWHAKLRKNYVRDSTFETRQKFRTWFYDRLLRNLNKK
jgi:hypothetical protein